MKRLFLSVVSIMTIGFLLLTQTACKNNNECNIAAPTGVKFPTLTSSGVSISWDAVSGAFNYQVELLDSLSNATVESKTASATETGFTKLTADRAYKVKITARCSKDQLSSKVAMGNFHTPKELCNLPAPLNLKVNKITASSATVTWDAVPGAIAYQVQILDSLKQSPVFQILDAPTNSIDVINLASNKVYLAKVTPRCASSTLSQTSSQTSFRTKSIIIDDIIMKSNNDCTKDMCAIGSILGSTETFNNTGSHSHGVGSNSCQVFYIRIVDKSTSNYSDFRLIYKDGYVYFRDMDCNAYKNPPTWQQGTNTLVGDTNPNLVLSEYTISINLSSFVVTTNASKYDVFVEE